MYINRENLVDFRLFYSLMMYQVYENLSWIIFVISLWYLIFNGELFIYSSSWYPLLTQNLKDRIQISQNKCIRFCLSLNNRNSVDETKFIEINWLPIKKRVEQYICSLIFKYLNSNVPEYIEDMFILNVGKYNTRNPNMLKQPQYRTSNGQKAIYYLGLSYGMNY